ncbi:MAG: DUF1566 domain-containing protein [bacterium]
MSQEQQEQVLQNSEPQSVDVIVNVGGDSRAERLLGTFDQISRLSLDIDRNYGNKRVLSDFPLEHDGSKWTGTINKLIVGFDYTITGHAYKCVDCSDNVTRFSKDSSLNIVIDDLEDIIWDLNNADRYQAWSIQDNFCRTSFSAGQYGVGNWRLPTKTELVSLVDNSSSPKILNTFLDDTYESPYWTGTVDENNSEKYYVVNFSDGSLTTKS